jgi:hypothetical protein
MSTEAEKETDEASKSKEEMDVDRRASTPFNREEVSIPLNTTGMADLPLNRQDSGSRPSLTLSFENLTVHVPGQTRSCTSSIFDPFRHYAEEYMGMSVENKEPFYALDGISGVIQSGEMCVVLSVNDVATSTLIRALSGRQNTQDEVHGTILLNGMPLGKSNQGWRRMSPYGA